MREFLFEGLPYLNTEIHTLLKFLSEKQLIYFRGKIIQYFKKISLIDLHIDIFHVRKLFFERFFEHIDFLSHHTWYQIGIIRTKF